MFSKEISSIENNIINFLNSNEIQNLGSLNWTSIPFSGEWGSSTSFFEIAALEARAGKIKNVPERAQQIAELVALELKDQPGISRIEAVRGYLNLYYDTSEFSKRVISTVLNEETEYGRGAKKNSTLMIEFSHPNTHKSIHVGHLRNMMLGDAIANILDFAGYDVVRANYFGDYGKDVIKWMWNFQKNHQGEKPPDQDKTKWMGDLYAKATNNLESDPDGEAEIKEMFAKWENRDPEVYNLWKETRQWSLDGFFEVYDILGIKFDKLYYESDMEAPGKEMVQKLIEMGIAEDERSIDGPVIVKIDEKLGLDKENYRVMVLMRSDGTALYGAWDLALAQQKFEDYPELDKSIYVVDVRQSLHFKQVFKTLDIFGWDKSDQVLHLPYEIVTLPGNLTMSSRDGIVVLLEDLIRESIKLAFDTSKERNPELDDGVRKSVAEAVGIGAIKYPLLSIDKTKIATFDWETALDFNGRSAPYILYAYVRTNSLLKRAGEIDLDNIQLTHDLEEKEIQLIELMSQFPAVVQRAAQDYKVLHISSAAYELAKAFNEFYNNCQVLKADDNIRKTRLQIVSAAKIAIANSLRLLGIPVPEVM
jgi:arginyl-tRNA synthetase